MGSFLRSLRRLLALGVIAVVAVPVLVGTLPANAVPRGVLSTAAASADRALTAVAGETAGATATDASTTSRAAAADPDPADFDPGLIISDYNFFNAHAMTVDEIQDFLEARSCSPRDDSPCLWEYRQTTETQPDQGAGHCTAYTGAANERASRILAKVATACNVSPEVLLVLLQKEQSLLTTPGASGYLRATGYGCPDTADCNTKYFGFFNQVYSAAWQFRQYTQEPERAYKIGTVDVGFHPNAACGTAPIDIRNQATANLYNYTPYQPNASLLAAAKAEGDACSAYGNLNFWTLYNRWFGPSTTERYPQFLDPCLNLVGGQPCRATSLIPTR
jgi:hypothetical protein